jgi:putative tryptophan/tyrosine transport system substrate-binding protein
MSSIVALNSFSPDTWMRAVYFVDRLLKGAKVADLPVEQLSTYKLVVSLKAAKALSIKLPESVLLRADEVIR